MSKVEWIAVDWGTSNLRAWAIGMNNEVVAELNSDRGMGTLRSDEFEAVLVHLLDPYLGDECMPVLCCGMVGAKQGWSEATYAKTPCAPGAVETITQIASEDIRISVSILPGVMQTSPADVMRGEETQIAGFIAENPRFDGTLCLPGTHTKWVQISAEEIVSFRTFMTGEMFALLSQRSVLRHGVAGDEWSNDAFIEAVEDSMSSPQQLASRLFGIRAEGLVRDQSQGDAKARLSGLLIGQELAGARGYWLGQDVALIGDPNLTELYNAALEKQGVIARSLGGAEMTLAGLSAAYKATKDEPS
mgnify:FL=1